MDTPYRHPDNNGTSISNFQLSVIEPILSLLREKKWSTPKSKKDCMMSEINVPYMPLTVHKIEKKYNCSLAAFRTVVCDTKLSTAREIDGILDNIKVLECRDGVELQYITYKKPAILASPRDFIIHKSDMILPREDQLHFKLPFTADEMFILVNRSVPDSVKPPVKNVVRSYANIFGYVAVPTGANSISVTNFVCVNPAGSVPSWAVTAGVMEQAAKLIRVLKMASKVRVFAKPPVRPVAPPPVVEPKAIELSTESDSTDNGETYPENDCECLADVPITEPELVPLYATEVVEAHRTEEAAPALFAEFTVSPTLPVLSASDEARPLVAVYPLVDTCLSPLGEDERTCLTAVDVDDLCSDDEDLYSMMDAESYYDETFPTHPADTQLEELEDVYGNVEPAETILEPVAVQRVVGMPAITTVEEDEEEEDDNTSETEKESVDEQHAVSVRYDDLSAPMEVPVHNFKMDCARRMMDSFLPDTILVDSFASVPVTRAYDTPRKPMPFTAVKAIPRVTSVDNGQAFSDAGISNDSFISSAVDTETCDDLESINGVTFRATLFGVIKHPSDWDGSHFRDCPESSRRYVEQLQRETLFHQQSWKAQLFNLGDYMFAAPSQRSQVILEDN
ncbi:hypothetical protein, conserved [Angomonas deanei]|uniref:START domain-containing protein n=1 Tax=Angomonas deanei TaxID=59799 RepID=A0A7G2C098_9TRYP|nr:hypothetical protein, conserved [Angomonas deanei]